MAHWLALCTAVAVVTRARTRALLSLSLSLSLSLRYTPMQSGVHHLVVALNHAGVHADLGPLAADLAAVEDQIAGSPFVVAVASGSASAAHSWAYGTALLSASAGVSASFIVQVRGGYDMPAAHVL